MTCIVAVSEGRTVTLGGDSAGVMEEEMHLRADPKVFRSGPYAIGFTTSFRMGQLLRYADLPTPAGDLDRFMVTDFVDAVRTLLKRGGFAKQEYEVETGGIFLVGFGNQIFEVRSDYQVARPVKPFTAVGSGARVALGALAALERQPGLSAADRARIALEAAQEYCSAVRAPFRFVDSRDLGSA